MSGWSLVGTMACVGIVAGSAGSWLGVWLSRRHHDVEITALADERAALAQWAELLELRRDHLNRGVTLGTPATPETPSDVPPRGRGVRAEDDDTLSPAAAAPSVASGGGRHRAEGRIEHRSPRAAPAPPSLLTATLDVALEELAQIRAQHRWVSRYAFPAALSGERVNPWATQRVSRAA